MVACAPEEPGELVHHGALVAMGYWNDAEKTAERFKLLPAGLPGRPVGLQLPEVAVFSGDTVRQDADGYLWIMGRIDDVLNVSGHRLSTMEVESALVAHEKVAEAAVVGRPDELKGQAISAFVTLEQGVPPTEELKEELKKWVAKEIGSLAKPDDIRFTDTLPKTRSGKIMRRLLRELASSGEVKGDTTTLEDFGVIAKLKEQDEV